MRRHALYPLVLLFTALTAISGCAMIGSLIGAVLAGSAPPAALDTIDAYMKELR